MVKFYIREEIKTLARFAKLKEKLFLLVGGFVRDSILGRSVGDIDSAGTLSIDDIKLFCESNNCKMEIKNKKLQVVKIIFFSGFCLEYAKMRVEYYASNFLHNPTTVQFTEKIEEDFARRDYTINAIYYDPRTHKVYDFAGGMSDITQGIIRDIVVLGRSSLSVDPERILRGIELAERLQFAIDEETIIKMLKNFENVYKLNSDRLLECLQKINSHNNSLLDERLKQKIKELNDYNKNIG